MRIRPALRHACAALVCALAVVGPGAATAWSQSLIEALSTTYNSNPDLLASRALLRQTDETLAQAVANWRPRVTLSLEYNKLEADSLPSVPRERPTTSLNGRYDAVARLPSRSSAAARRWPTPRRRRPTSRRSARRLPTPSRTSCWRP